MILTEVEVGLVATAVPVGTQEMMEVDLEEAVEITNSPWTLQTLILESS